MASTKTEAWVGWPSEVAVVVAPPTGLGCGSTTPMVPSLGPPGLAGESDRSESICKKGEG